MIWYIAELIVEMKIENEPRNVVHINSHLISARSETEALQKAKLIGREYAYSYKNTDGKKVKVRFRGIGSLYELLDGVTDGAEILWEEHIGVDENKIKSWLKRTPIRGHSRKEVPNYMPESVMKSLEDAGFDRKKLC